MRELKSAMFKEILTASIWAAFGLCLMLATQPVWSYWLSGKQLSIADQLSIRCFGF